MSAPSHTVSTKQRSSKKKQQQQTDAHVRAHRSVKKPKPKPKRGEDGDELSFSDGNPIPLGIFRYTFRLRYDQPSVDVNQALVRIIRRFNGNDDSELHGWIHANKPTKDGTYRFSFEVPKYKDATGALNKTSIFDYAHRLFAGATDVRVVAIEADPAFGAHELYM